MDIDKVYIKNFTNVCGDTFC